MKRHIITLLTDFGTRDPYVGVIKGVILSINPDIIIIDLSHQIEKHNIREGAFFLLSILKYYPKDTIHLVVIDPGVGSRRKAIIIQTKNYLFVGPDNGVLSPAATKDGIQRIIEINNAQFFLSPVSQTFHGRDIFAPIAAHLTKSQNLDQFGVEIYDWEQYEFPEVQLNEEEILGEVIHIDRFGNIITNISKQFLYSLIGNKIHQTVHFNLTIKNQNMRIPLCYSYNQVAVGEFLTIYGSTDFLEISRNQSSAADALNCKVGEKIKLSLK
ncbi:MAG: SAM hydrolase/SAM-dependent halogenase family protein [Candidatus Helarchaeota archaeon]